jgi:hypothetical protein
VTEDAVVNAVVDFTNVRYALIEGFRTETGHEHIVIAYPNEKSLRDLFAAPSIVASGFATRDEAVRSLRTREPEGEQMGRQASQLIESR